MKSKIKTKQIYILVCIGKDKENDTLTIRVIDAYTDKNLASAIGQNLVKCHCSLYNGYYVQEATLH